MKNMSKFLTAAILFVGANTFASTADYKATITNDVMNSLSEENLFDGLPEAQIAKVKNSVETFVGNELVKMNNDLDLSDGAKNAFLGDIWDKAKDLGKSIIDTAKKGLTKIKDVASAVFSKAKDIVKKYGSKLKSFAKDLLPKFAPVAATISQKFGLPLEVAQGLVAQNQDADASVEQVESDAAAAAAEMAETVEE